MGPLSGFRIIELAGIGGIPFTGMLLADLGAEVIRIERSSNETPMSRTDASNRGKKSIVLDLKNPEAVNVVLDLVGTADALIEGFRPGVMEKLGLGPDVCAARNESLVYGRLTGWGQTGPLSGSAGHDINYISIVGVLDAMRTPGNKPSIPLNLIGDMGGGGMLLAFGVVAGLLEASRSNKGQVVDAAMSDGASLLMWLFHGFSKIGFHNVQSPGTNLLDGGAHFYNTYETLDNKFVSIGSIEPQFYAELLQRLEISDADLAMQMNADEWPGMQQKLATLFATKTRDEWQELLEGTDVCFAPVLSIDEATEHPHNQERQAFVEVDQMTQPAPAPRFSRTPPGVTRGTPKPGSDALAILDSLGYTSAQIKTLKDSQALG